MLERAVRENNKEVDYNIHLISGLATRNNVIGYKGKLPWSNKLDMGLFVKTVGASDVVMGRNTYEELTRPIGKGRNFVVTSRPDSLKEGFHPLTRVEDIQYITNPTDDIFICGGESIYRKVLELSEKEYWFTRVGFKATIHSMDYDVNGDTHFPMNEMIRLNFVLTKVQENYNVNGADIPVTVMNFIKEPLK